MDEVDIDNMEDLNDLEARLYAQIHHEPTNTDGSAQLSQNDNPQVFNVNANNKGDLTPNYELSSNTNRNLSKRYWASTESDESQRRQEQTQYNQHIFIRNPFKTPNNEKRRKVSQQPKHAESSANKVLNPFKENKLDSSIQNANEVITDKTTTENAAPSLVNNDNEKNVDVSINNLTAKQKQNSEESDLKLNPVADWMKRKKTHINKNSNRKRSSVNIKQGLFSRQQQKLEKLKRIEEKKKRFGKTKNAAAFRDNKIKPTEIIDLDSDNESDSSDVILIPTATPPTFTVDDSADEDEKDKGNITMAYEENAVDSTDVQLSATTARFIKPKEICTQSLITADGDERRIENSSRCTSPCSIQSSDDFIRNIDRVRLLAGRRGVADDEDLLELTSDINIMVESSDISKQNLDDNVCLEENKNQLHCNQQEIHEENVETSDTLEFVAPKTTTAPSRDYRVDHSQFKALDVYESESDINDNVYSKGASKSTVIRQIDSSSDAVEEVSELSQRTKRLRKRRASSSNKESEPNNENVLSSSDDESIEDDNKVLRTPVAYIAKGPAVERYNPHKRNRALTFSSNLQNSKMSNTTVTSGNTSDTEFLTTLNNLAHGQDGVQETQKLDESEESETENVPTAREMAEKILAKHNATAEINNSFTDDMALPNDILNDLDKVFETIDQLDRENSNNLPTFDNTVNISESSDSDRERNFLYQSIPNEDAQIIKYSPKNSVAKTHDENGSPIYNVIYIRGSRKPGGIGWIEEMRKFYNDSWKGEHFFLRKILQKMNPEKNLWKIYTEDRFNIKSNKHSNIKCTNCCEFGHKRSKCKRPRKPLICYMCGESGHYEPRCPNTVCLRCGNKTQVFTKSCNVCTYQNRLTCPICKMRGHSLDYCPDKWRRYHSTTEANVHPNNKVDYNPRKYCCVCGARGHISDFCRSALRFLEYPTISSSIKSHQKSYNDVVVRTPHNGIALNLMYEPSERYKLGLVEQTSLDNYYGRFLKAVGLDFLLRRKRYSRTAPAESSEITAKKAKRLSKRYEANPYMNAAAANRRIHESMESVPNQVQEITESGNTDQHIDESRPEEVINVEDKNENEVKLTATNEEEVVCNIQLNKIIGKPDGVEKSKAKNFKSSKNVTTSMPQMETSLQLDSDLNYNFSENDVRICATDEEQLNCNIQLNTTSEKSDSVKSKAENFISPKDIKMGSSEKISKPQMERSLQLDSDASYNFSGNKVIISAIDAEKLSCNTHLNTINGNPVGVESKGENFKSPQFVTTASSENISKPQVESHLQLDSDSNYSFSEHFDVASNLGSHVTTPTEEPITLLSQTTGEVSNDKEINEEHLATITSRPKAREMGVLPDFIPLIDSTENQTEQNYNMDHLNAGISRKFVAAESEDEDMLENSRCFSTFAELPCEAKIYLTQFHTKYLLSPEGTEFLLKSTRAHKLKARLDFTSVGHVLVIFGLVSNQDNFQKELLLKYRDLEDEINRKQVQSIMNVPKRTFVLIKFLRENITQLMYNLGNANQLLNRLQYLERQQTKTGFKLAEKVRRSLNMILVGQAGLRDGTVHLDKLLTSLKTLLNDVTTAVVPPELRSEIADHWKVIFSAYRHDNYQQLVEAYNELVSKNRLPQLNIDPLLLGQKVLDTSFSEEQKQKLEQSRMQVSPTTKLPKQNLAYSLNQMNPKNSNSKQNTEAENLSKPSVTNTTPNPNITKTTTLRADNDTSNIKKKSTSNKTSTLQNLAKTSFNASTSSKMKFSNATIPNTNKTQQPSNANSRPTNGMTNEASKQQPQTQIGSPAKRLTVSTSIQEVTGNWQSSCDTLLTKISSESRIDKNLSGEVRDSQLPSVFWSRESMRYLDDCIRLAGVGSEVVERLQRVRNKSRNCQLSYNDYLDVIKLHTALNRK